METEVQAVLQYLENPVVVWKGEVPESTKPEYVSSQETSENKTNLDIVCDHLSLCDFKEEEWLAEELKRDQEVDSSNITPWSETKLNTDIKKDETEEQLSQGLPVSDNTFNLGEHANETLDTDTKDEMTQTSSLMFEDRESSVADMYICKFCLKVFINQYKLESHMYRKHNSKKPIKDKKPMPHMSKKYDVWPPSVQELARRVNGKKIFFCDQCPYFVNRCDSMTKHIIRVHSEGRPVPQYQCEVCGKVFLDKAYLRNHKVSHVTEKQYKCEICSREFHRQPSLKRHVQTHSQNKQFSCTICEYETNRKHLMYKHVELHQSGRAFTCKYCSAQFYTQLSLRAHLYTHKLNANTCSFCRVCFSSKERMLCHMRSVHFSFEIKELKEDSDN